MLTEVRKDLKSYIVPGRAEIYASFFKTGKGEYGEGDKFLGVAVPESRAVAKKHVSLPLKDLKNLLRSLIHEERLTALLILVERYKQGNKQQRDQLYKYYLKNTRYVNNWDLVDLTADKIVGQHLYDKERGILYQLAKSKNLWERRIAIVATFWFIKNNEFVDTFKISELLLNDKHDLIHKAIGWMLREVGKRDGPTLERFLKRHYQNMPRTMLRYAIERFEEGKRRRYLEK